MAKKPYTLVKRKDRLTNGKPTFYARFRDDAGNSTAWQSTGENAKSRAELRALAEIEKRKSARPGSDTTLSQFAKDFLVPGRCSYLKHRAAKGRSVSEPWARTKRQMLVNHVFPKLGGIRLDKLNRPMIERFLVDIPRSRQTRNHLLYTLKTVLAEAEAEDLIARNPLEHAEPLGKKACKRYVFSLEELQLLFPGTDEGLLAV